MSYQNWPKSLGDGADVPTPSVDLPTLLKDLAGRGIELSFEGDRLRVHSNDQPVEHATITKLKELEVKIITYLRDQASRQEVRFPVSNGQRAMWLLNQQAPQSSAYHLAAPLRVTSTINANALRHAVQALTDRHATLRTTYHYVDGVLWQKVRGAGSPELNFHEAHGLTQEELFAKVKADYQRPFDLAGGPVWRTSLYTLGPTEHVLIVVVHHIATDGWSHVMLVDELFKLYSEAVGGPDANLPRPSVEFTDYVAWQEQMLAGSEGDRLWKYWSSKLSGPLPRLDLATDYPRPAIQKLRGASFSFVLGPDLTEATNALARQEGTTPFVVLLAAYQSLLYRLTGAEDIIVGFPAFARTQKKFVRVAGNFVNTLPLRGTLDEAATFQEFLAQIRVAVGEAIDAQEYPFSLIVQRLQPDRDPSRAPLFDASFVLQRFHKYRVLEGLLSGEDPDSSVELGKLRVKPYLLPQQEGPFDLTLQVVERAGALHCIFKYNSDLFERSTIERFAGCFDRLLEGLTRSPGARISELPIVAPSELHRLLIDWNRTETDSPANECVHHLFEEWARRTPQATAVVFGDRQLTYFELNARANQLAHYLRKLGVGPDMLVGLLVERSIEMIVGLLGILKAGGAYVPLDAEYPKERLSFIVADTGLGVMVTHEGLDHGFLEHKLRFVYLDRDDDTLSAESKEDPADNLNWSNLAYVIYTSGSTGLPKGVLVEHRGLCNVADAQIRAFGLKAGDRVLQYASISFDASIFEIVAAFGVGATLQLGRSIEMMPGPDLARFLERNKINFVTLAPSALMVTPEVPLPALRVITVAGEACPIELSRRWAVGRRFFNLYGPTEATIWATAAELGSDPDRVTIGRPISNTTLYILDKNLAPVPVGVVGELFIGGQGVARGYLNRPEMTAERFIPDPFNGEPGARLYKTGDVARYLPDGSIEWLGRSDFQVKIRGFRIELGEIEQVTRQHAAVRDVVAVVREDLPGDKRIVIYVRAEGAGEALTEELRARLRQKLPAYMVPSNLVVVETFPLLPNGKIDRGALSAPDGRRRAEPTYAAPRTATEQSLASVWSDVLRLEKVGIHDNFFELGGHSLLVVTLIQRMRMLGMAADMHMVFLHPTLEALAAAVAELQGVDDHSYPASDNSIPDGCEKITPAMVPLVSLNQDDLDRIVSGIPEQGKIEDILPLLPMQEGILFHHRLVDREGTDTYLARFVLAFRERKTLDQFLAAMQVVVDRHAALRVAIMWTGLSHPVQVVYREARLNIHEIAAGTDDPFRQLLQVSDPQKLRLDLTRPTLVTAFVAESRDDEECRLALVVHHVILDHVSLDIMFGEAQSIMQGHRRQLPPTPRYQQLVRQISRKNRAAEHEAFFRNMLGDLERPTLLFDLADVRGSDTEAREARATLSNDLSVKVRRAALQQGVSTAVLFHVAWALVVARYTGQSDVVFATVLLGRSSGLPGFDRAIGAFINTLPIRVTFDGSVAELIARTYQNLAGLISHDQGSLAVAQRCSKVSPRSPLFNTILNYRHTSWKLNDGVDREHTAGADAFGILSGEERANYPIGMAVDDTGSGFLLVAHCSNGVVPEQILTSMNNAVELLVETIQSNIDSPSRNMMELRSLSGSFDSAAESPPRAANEEPGLRSPATGRPEGEPVFGVEAAPQGATEEVLHDIWREVLRTDQFGRFDNFFDLGGHSLLATQVASRIFRSFGLELPLRVIFEARTLESLARRIEAALGSDNRATIAPPIEPARGEQDLVLSHSQQRMWLIQSLDPQNSAYNMSVAIRLRGRLDVSALGEALDEMRRRHENLRSTFIQVDDEVRQHIGPWRSENLNIADLRRLGSDAKLEAVRRAEADARTPIDLARGPIMRQMLFRVADEEYLLHISLHHISGDQWSFGIIGRELAAAYNALRAGRPIDLEPIKIRYRDFALWQRRYFDDHQAKDQLSYWTEKLEDLPPLALPTDFPRPHVRGLSGASYLTPIPSSLVAKLERLSRSEGGTLFMTMLAAFALQLYRLTSQDDFAIGVPIANRTQADVEEMVGSFVNTLALRIELSGGPSFRDLLARVRAAALDAYAHQDISFDKLVEKIKHQRDDSRAPLVQVMFNMLNAPFYGVSFDELAWEPVAIDRGGAQFELSLSVDVQISNAMIFEYNTDLFARETIERFAAQYLEILKSIADDSTQSIASVPMLPENERRLLLHDWNATRTNDGDRPLFVSMFEHQVAQYPDVPAVSFEGQTVSYAVLNARANTAARNLFRLGIGPGKGVALCIKRSIDLVVMLLGIQKSGAYYVPLDPSFPGKRLEYMLADSGVSALVVDPESKERLTSPAGIRVLDCASLMVSDAADPDNPVKGASSSDVAYIIYTSGSTGQPKGVAVEHRSLSNFLLSMSRSPGLSRGDVLAAVTTVSFDIAALELYLPLSVGARIELVSKEAASDAALLSRLLVESGATVLQATPATWRMLVEGGWMGRSNLRALCGGEALSRDLADTLLERVSELWNLYGPTETTIWSSIARVEAGTSPISIGRPIDNTRIYIANPEGELSPIGTTGEILIAGEGVAKGYHGRPEATVERFLADRFSEDGIDRLYRTGDLGKWGANGLLYHLGRIDGQVKVRGFRIETGEIETILRQHVSVAQAVVVAREVSPGDSRLAAYIVQTGEEVTVSELRNHLRVHLPDYMIPSFVVTIDEIPLTPNGKVDRKALPDPFARELEMADEFVAPAAGMEELIAAIWRETLKVERVSALDNFFELGGHSLLAVRVAAMVKRNSGRSLDPRMLFFKNLRQIAEAVAHSRS